MIEVTDILREGRARELEQALFYRFLSSDAEASGNAAMAERLNELLADEQHHVSRLTARLLELGEKPADARAAAPSLPYLAAWEEEARRREGEEVAWYESALARIEDPETAAVLAGILASERHHREKLSGKWMSAVAGDVEEEG
jgi:rubrerythrin